MKILLLEDCPFRKKKFEVIFSGFTFEMLAESVELDGMDVFVTEKSDEAIASVLEGGYDVFFLDHDLSEEDIMCHPGDNTVNKTGYDFLCDLEEKVYNGKIEALNSLRCVVVHSLNPGGRKRMIESLKAIRKRHSLGFSISEHPFVWSNKKKVFEYLREALKEQA